MPVAIVVRPESASISVLSAPTNDALLAEMGRLAGVPKLADMAAARRWLYGLPSPSGLYRDRTEAMARLVQELREDPMAGEELAAIRASLNQSRSEFGDALGFLGTPNTRHKQLWEMERGRKPILPERARRARSLAALRQLDGAGPNVA